MSIGKTRDQKVSGSNPLGRATFFWRILVPKACFKNIAPNFWARSIHQSPQIRQIRYLLGMPFDLEAE